MVSSGQVKLLLDSKTSFIYSLQVEKNAAADGGREKWDPIWGQFHMLRRCADCREVARPILFLCSNDASFITAIDLAIDGGYLQMTHEGFGEKTFATSSVS